MTEKQGVTTPFQISESYVPGKKRILFVDDEKQLVNIVQQMLERLGYEVTLSTSSVEALEIFKKEPDCFDLVITDMLMPNMNGEVLASELLKLRQDMPVIFVTGNSNCLTADKINTSGVKEFIIKPFGNA